MADKRTKEQITQDFRNGKVEIDAIKTFAGELGLRRG